MKSIRSKYWLTMMLLSVFFVSTAAISCVGHKPKSSLKKKGKKTKKGKPIPCPIKDC